MKPAGVIVGTPPPLPHKARSHGRRRARWRQWRGDRFHLDLLAAGLCCLLTLFGFQPNIDVA